MRDVSMKCSLFPRQQALACLVLLLPIGAWAELPDPLDSTAATMALDYQSPLKAYQGFREQPLQNWREANDLVGRIGGWRTYAMEPWEQPSDSAPAPSAIPMGDNPHDHH
jgi:hypothetical protein